MPENPKAQEPLHLSKRDLDLIQYQRALQQKASFTSPQTMLQGADLIVIRKFAMESFMPMKTAMPDVFRDKTIDDWEKAIKEWITTRRPEFREEVLQKLRDRYSGKGTPENLSTLLSESAAASLKKQSSAQVAMIKALEAFGR